jgi:hypothetical protein
MDLETQRLNQSLSSSIIVIDNFYEDPFYVREFCLKRISEFVPHDYHPGIRTNSYASLHHREMFDSIIEPFYGKIVKFDTSRESINSNGSFQLNVSHDDKSWIHVDSSVYNWAGIIYLTPDAPVSGGTGFFKYKNGDILELSLEQEKKNGKDNSKWEIVSTIGNIFNRLVLFRANQYHMSLDYFGEDFNDGRLIQLFFFSTEK